MAREPLDNALSGVLVLEIGEEYGEFAGLLMASFGAEVVKLEPVSGARSRGVGPFFRPEGSEERSLHFERYNLAKKSVGLELGRSGAPNILARLALKADVIIDSGEPADVESRFEIYQKAQEANPRLTVCTLTPFGLTGPYRSFKMTDLTHLAMGGVMASCGYDPNDDGLYDTPPIAPAMCQAYHIASEHAVIAISAALSFREITGQGDRLDVSVHEAVSTCTEVALPSYIYNQKVVRRQTGRHAGLAKTPQWLRRSKDGRFVKAFLFWGGRDVRVISEMLDDAGIKHDLASEEYRALADRAPRKAHEHFSELVDVLVASMTAEEVFHKAQAKGLWWASVRYPEENMDDPHFQARGTFQAIPGTGAGDGLLFPVSVGTDGADRLTSLGRRAPHFGEHTREVLRSLGLQESKIQDLTEAGAVIGR